MRCSVGNCPTLRLSRHTAPPSSGNSPTIAFISVVLPAPLRPRIATPPRHGTLRLTSNRTWLRPYPASRLLISRYLSSGTAEINLLDLGAGLDFLNRAAIEHAALIQHRKPVADVAN